MDFLYCLIDIFPFLFVVGLMIWLLYRGVSNIKLPQAPQPSQTQLTYRSLIPLHDGGKFAPVTFKSFDPPLVLFPFKERTILGFESLFSFPYIHKYFFKGEWRKKELWVAEFSTPTAPTPRFIFAVHNPNLPRLIIRPRQATDLLKEALGEQFIDLPALANYDLALFMYEQDKFSAQWVNQFPPAVWNILSPGRSVVICDGQWFLFYNRPLASEDNVTAPENFLYQALGLYNALSNPLENL